MSDYTQLALDILVDDDSYVCTILAAVKKRATGDDIDLNKLVDNLYDSAYMSAVQRVQEPDSDDYQEGA